MPYQEKVHQNGKWNQSGIARLTEAEWANWILDRVQWADKLPAPDVRTMEEPESIFIEEIRYLRKQKPPEQNTPYLTALKGVVMAFDQLVTKIMQGEHEKWGGDPFSSVALIVLLLIADDCNSRKPSDGQSKSFYAQVENIARTLTEGVKLQLTEENQRLLEPLSSQYVPEKCPSYISPWHPDSISI